VYADDVMIWGNKIKVLEDKVNEWNNIGKEFGLKINLRQNSDDKNLQKSKKRNNETGQERYKRSRYIHIPRQQHK
jgi:hypothetical protein